MRLSFVFIFCIAFCAIYCENSKSTYINITLNKVISDSVPFKRMFRFASVDSTQSISLAGIDSIAIYKIDLQDDFNKEGIKLSYPLRNQLLCLTGISKTTKKRIVILDTNNDGKLNDEKPYFMDEDLPYLKVSNVKYLEGDSIKEGIFNVKPSINKEFQIAGYKKLHPFEIIYFGVFVRPVYYYGTLKTEEGTYKFALFNYFQNKYSSETSFLSVVPANGAFPSPLASPVYSRQGDVIYLGKKGYIFKSMSKDGRQITLEALDSTKRNEGADSGLYAYPIQANDLRTGKKYSLGTSKKYTILDFWGTWCGPCLKLLPDLVALNELNKKYNFEIVSIAYDDNPKGVIDHIEREGIFWTNLYDDRNNSIITDKYRVDIFPTFILINKEGKIIARGAGKDALEKITKILKNT